MEESDDKMLSGDTNIESKWSTREKLAIASYVLRSGEQHWSGVGRLLKPLGEKERPPDWFSPKSCAQQYTALLEQQDAPKRKRSSDHSGDSAENVQPGTSTEEAIVSRLTRERIEELKKQLRTERTEYRKLKQEIEQIETGVHDDNLDALLGQLENNGEVNECEAADDTTKDVALSKDEIEQMVQSVAEEMKTELEKLQNTPFQQNIPSIDSAETEKPSANMAGSLNELVVADGKKEEDDEGIQMLKEFTDILKSDEQNIAANISNEDVEQTLIDKSITDKNEHMLDGDIVEQKLMEAKNNSEAEGDTQQLTETNALPPDEKKLDSFQSKPEADISSSQDNEQTQETKPINDDSLISEITEEGDSTFNYSVDDSTMNSMSLPGTPRAGSLLYDSFPSSPALSHSSDMDPDSAASWKAWRKSIMILWKQVASHRYASLFLQPVTDDIAPNYSTTVYRNMDLSVLKKNVENGTVRTTKEFHRDVMLMFQNAIMYNNREHDVYKMTMEMQKDVMDQVAQFMSTQMIAETAQPTANKSLRRSTMRRAVLTNEKSNEFRTRRSATAETESKTTH